MDISEILKKLNLSPNCFATFSKCTFMRPQLHSKDNSLSIKILSENFIDISEIDELTDKLKQYLAIEVKLIFAVTNNNISTTLLLNYLNYYLTKKNISKQLIPIVSDEYIEIDADIQLLHDISLFLSSLGINKKVIQKKTVEPINNEVVISSSRPVSSSRAYKSKSTFTTEEDYPFVSMDKLSANNQKVSCIGKVFSVVSRSGKSSKTGKAFEIETFVVSDFTDAIFVKRFKSENANELVSLDVYDGMIVKIYGKVQYDSYDNSDVFQLDKIEEVQKDPFILKDDYPGKKHIELHCHTNRSEYDGVSETKELINQAYKFNQKAIAITDNCVVQAYPLAQQAHLAIDGKNPDNDFKVIYGIDVKMVDDKLNIVYNPNDNKLKNQRYCVFDLETTGLSVKYDHIIEFGAVIVENNHLTDQRLQLFIKPPVKLPAFIVNKTNITNEMLQDALPFDKAIDIILDFIKDSVLVAHNADFDFNFINEKLMEINRQPLTNTCLDTLNLARMIVKNRKYYRLGVIAKYYGVEYDEETAHRGDYDAEVLANVLVKMFNDIDNFDQISFNQLQNDQPQDIIKKARPYSVTLLAKDMIGIKSIYEIVSLSHTKYLTYFAKENAKKIDNEIAAEPRIYRSEIEKRREHLLIGSCDQYSQLFEIALNRSLADLKKHMEFYDYIEIEPLDNYDNLIEAGSSVDRNRIKQVINDLISTADSLNKKVVASSNCYYTYPYQNIARDIYIMGKRIGGIRHPLYPYSKEKRKNFTSPKCHLMTTQQLLDEFAWTNRAEEFVIDNPNAIADLIEKEYPIAQELHTPKIEGCEKILAEEIYRNAHNIYGDPLPKLVSERIEKELTSVIKSGYPVQYYIAYLLVKQSDSDGYPVGSRGSVGSSFIATMANITEVNPLVPHYVCPDCHYSEFFENNEYANGFDLPVKMCPKCGKELNRNGHNIPFETFLGFNGDKVPDIDLNFSAEYQGKAMQQIKDIFGKDYSYRAGTIGTVAQKTAYGYVKGYCEEIERPYFSKAFNEVLSKMCEGVKRTTGQHPGGIVVIPKENEVHDFTPIQYPANNPFSDWLTTHFAFADLHDNILKLDILAHVDPTSIRMLSQFSGYHYKDVPMSDPEVYQLFYCTDSLHINDPKGYYHEKNGAAGLPEFGTHNNRRILAKTQPKTFNELVAFEGVTHGTDVWTNNAEVLVDKGICSFSEVISCRDDIMTYLISKGMDKKMSFQIMEKVRKGKGLTAEWIEEMKKHNVPDWYINSCQLIKYMFPKAHAVAYAMNAVRVGWYKVHCPAAYYAVFFSIRCDAYDIETMIKGEDAIYERLTQIQNKMASNEKVSKKEEDLEIVLEIALEMYLRGFHFNNISLEKSQAINFIIDPDDDHGIIPSFNSIDGLGSSVADSIVQQREICPFISKEDIMKRTSVNNTQLSFMERIGVLDGLNEENQLSLF
ncbi:MAG: PolC-type DNA polymerase III [Erysipelotrichaceae bacterium]